MSVYLQLGAKRSPFFTKSEEEMEEREITTKKKRLDFQEKKKQTQGRRKKQPSPTTCLRVTEAGKKLLPSVAHTEEDERMQSEAGENEPVRKSVVLGTCRHFGIVVWLRKRIIMMCNMEMLRNEGICANKCVSSKKYYTNKRQSGNYCQGLKPVNPYFPQDPRFL